MGVGKCDPLIELQLGASSLRIAFRAWRQRIKLWLRVQDGFAGVEVYGHGNVVVDGQPAALSFGIALGEADPSIELLATEYRDLKIVAGDTVAFSCAKFVDVCAKNRNEKQDWERAQHAAPLQGRRRAKKPVKRGAGTAVPCPYEDYS